MADVELRRAANRRGRAYMCLHCEAHGEKDVYIGEKFRVESHVWKYHILMKRVPYSCVICMFRCNTEEQWDKHLTGYRWHKVRAGEGVDFQSRRSIDPHVMGAGDMTVLGKEESVQFFMGRSKNVDITECTSPAQWKDILCQAVEAAEILTAQRLDTSTPAASVVEGNSLDESIQYPLNLSMSASNDNVEPFSEVALDLRVVKLTSDRAVPVVNPRDPGSVPTPKKRKRSASSSLSDSLSGSSTDSSYTDRPARVASQKKLLDSLVRMVIETDKLLQRSTERTSMLVEQLQGTMEIQEKMMVTLFNQIYRIDRLWTGLRSEQTDTIQDRTRDSSSRDDYDRDSGRKSRGRDRQRRTTRVETAGVEVKQEMKRVETGRTVKGVKTGPTDINEVWNRNYRGGRADKRVRRRIDERGDRKDNGREGADKGRNRTDTTVNTDQQTDRWDSRRNERSEFT